MGKAKKLKVASTPRHTPLPAQIQKDELARPTERSKDRSAGRKDEAEDYVDATLSGKILKQARQQVQELEDENEIGGGKIKSSIQKKTVRLGEASPDSDNDDDDDESQATEGGDLDGTGFQEESGIEVSERDQAAFAEFMNRSEGPRRTLADIIADKINEKRTEIETVHTDLDSLGGAKVDLDPRVIEMYEGVGKILSKYRSGKVPKAFKVIPQFKNWEDLLVITAPAQWSAAAMYQATRIFTAGLKEAMAQRFFNQILLPRVRDDIDYYQRLNFHLFQAIRKALFKPGAFFKGFLLPLCEGGDCTLREAIIIGSVLARNSIPLLHSCAVMLKIAEMEYSGANSIFLRIFFDKKYALPYRVVDSVVFHFIRFRSEKRELPVLWHQALLTFVQRYKGHVSSEQRDALLELLKHQGHYKITPEIRRELVNAKCRDLEVDEPMAEPAN